MKNPAHRVLVAFALFSLAWTSPVLAVSAPSQFIAKVYTEALGRAPTETEWVSAHGAFGSGVNATTLRAWAKPIYMSAEYDALYYDAEFGYDHEARLLTLFRGALNREPHPAGMAFWKDKIINQGMSWSAVVDAFLSTSTPSEFGNLVPAIRDKEGYGFGQTPIMDLTLGPVRPADGKAWAILNGTCSGHASHTTLQQCLYDVANNGGGTIGIVQKAVIRVNEPLIVPAGVTLQTFPAPSRQQYALYGRIIRNGAFLGPVVRLGRFALNGAGHIIQNESAAGARLRNVWVDGQRTVLDPAIRSQGVRKEQANVLVGGGLNTEVSNCVLTNPAGLLNLYVRGRVDFTDFASSSLISGNLVTGYSTCHTIPLNFCDGISVSNENAEVKDNHIVDATDVGITVFKAARGTDATPFRSQDSWVHDNRIIAAGNSAFAGIGIDPGHPALGDPEKTFPFGNGTNQGIRSNRIYTGQRGHFDAGLLIGTGIIPWWTCETVCEPDNPCKIYNPDASCTLIPSHHRGSGAVFADNRLGHGTTSMRFKFGNGIVVSGAFDVRVTGNIVYPRDTTDPELHDCGNFDIVRHSSSNWASFAAPEPPSYSMSDDLVNCLGHWPHLACPIDSPPYWVGGGGGCGSPPCEYEPAPTIVRENGVVVEVQSDFVSFSMPHRADLLHSVRIVDVSGRSLALVRHEGTGSAAVRWNGRGVAPGVYHYLASTNRGTLSGRFILVK